MHGKKSFLALSTAFAALFVGCEWTGTSESDSWSSAYDAMNFSGTYRAVTSATSLEEAKEDDEIATIEERVGTFAAGADAADGKTSKANVVPGSFHASAGGYVWNDDSGDGTLTFVPADSGSTETKPTAIPRKTIGSLTDNEVAAGDSKQFSLGDQNIVPGTVNVSISGDKGTQTFKDNGDRTLSGSGLPTGSVDYQTGVVTINWGGGKPPTGTVTAEYSKYPEGSSATSGYGRINYQSGAWALVLSPKMQAGSVITIRYSYYLKDSSTSTSYTTIYSTKEVTALTVAQNGQNLSITLNNGIVMSGKFTNVQQTGKVNQDTNAGYNTYNAQFQVQTPDSKMVGSLNYDLKTGYRMLNGSWTWGKNTYDVQAVGPAWLNSADASTLSAGVQQSQK